MKGYIGKLPIVLAIVVAVAVSGLLGLRLVRAAAPSIYFSPGSQSVAQGSVVTFTVRANPGTAMDTAALTVVYDPVKLEFVSVSAAGSPINSAAAPYSNTGSSVTGAYYTTTPVSGDVALATLSFRARVSSGSATLQFSTAGANGTLIASGGSDLGASLGSAAISFAAPPATPAPTTPTPTTPQSSGSGSKPQSSSSGGTGQTARPSGDSGTATPGTTSSGTQSSGQSTNALAPEASGAIAELKIGVYDKRGKPLGGKQVTLHSEPQTTTTDQDGFAVFKNVPLGDHTLSYEQRGVTYQVPVHVASADAQTVTLDFTQPNRVLAGVVSASLILSGVAILVVLMRRRGIRLTLPKFRKPPKGPLGPGGAHYDVPRQKRGDAPVPGMVVGGPDGVKVFTERK